MRADVYQKITDQIVAALEQGVRWHPPWKASIARDASRGPCAAIVARGSAGDGERR
jgi:antirestriction protein ArdC